MSAIGDFIERLKKMEDNVHQFQSHRIRVGWPDKPREASVPKNKRVDRFIDGKKSTKNDGRTTEDIGMENFIGPMNRGVTQAQIAKTLCYGRAAGETANGHRYNAIPARNFVAVMRKKHFRSIQHKFCDQLIEGVNLPSLGIECVSQLQNSIKDSNEYVPNAPSTIERKGSARPLIDTQTMLHSVSFEIK